MRKRVSVLFFLCFAVFLVIGTTAQKQKPPKQKPPPKETPAPPVPSVHPAQVAFGKLPLRDPDGNLIDAGDPFRAAIVTGTNGKPEFIIFGATADDRQRFFFDSVQDLEVTATPQSDDETLYRFTGHRDANIHQGRGEAKVSGWYVVSPRRLTARGQLHYEPVGGTALVVTDPQGCVVFPGEYFDCEKGKPPGMVSPVPLR